MNFTMRTVALTTALLAAATAHAGTGSLTLNATFGEGTDFSAADVNNLGQVAGINATANALQTWQSGSFSTLVTTTDTLELVGINNKGVVLYDTIDAGDQLHYATSVGGGTPVAPALQGLTLNGINDAGTLAGFYINGGAACGVTVSGGAIGTSSCLSGSDQAYLAINNAGDRVTTTITGATVQTALERSAGGSTALGALTSVAGVSDSGAVAGVLGGNAVLIYNGATTNMLSSVTGASNVKVYDINNNNQVVGQYTDAGGNAVAFLYGADGLTTLNSSIAASGLQWVEGTRMGLNDLGQLVMTVSNGNDLATALYTTPATSVPEPAAYALMGLGLAGISLVARRRRS